MKKTEARYIPALSFDWLTPFYDFLLKWVMREETFKRRLIARAGFQPGQKVLDLGCGTGTLTVLIKTQYPELTLTGLDGDPRVLGIARGKASSSKLDIRWDLGMAYDLPYPANSFDRVVTSLMMHHLTSENKRRTFQEIYRILKPGGELYIADFGSPHDSVMALVTIYMSRLEEAADNMKGRLPGFIQAAGFPKVRELDHFSTVFGPLSIFQAQKADSSIFGTGS